MLSQSEWWCNISVVSFKGFLVFWGNRVRSVEHFVWSMWEQQPGVPFIQLKNQKESLTFSSQLPSPLWFFNPPCFLLILSMLEENEAALASFSSSFSHGHQDTLQRRTQSGSCPSPPVPAALPPNLGRLPGSLHAFVLIGMGSFTNKFKTWNTLQKMMLRIKTVLQGRALLRATGGSDVLLRVSPVLWDGLLGAGCAGLRSSNSWSYFVNRSWFSKATLNKNELGRGPTLAVISSCLLSGWEGRQTAERSPSLGSEDRYLARVFSQKKPPKQHLTSKAHLPCGNTMHCH